MLKSVDAYANLSDKQLLDDDDGLDDDADAGGKTIVANDQLRAKYL